MTGVSQLLLVCDHDHDEGCVLLEGSSGCHVAEPEALRVFLQ